MGYGAFVMAVFHTPNNDDNHVPTLLTPVPVEQKAEFYGENSIRVDKDQKIIQTRLPERSAKYSSTTWHSWRNPNQSQKGWFGGSSSRKPVSPKQRTRQCPLLGARKTKSNQF
eukprot:1126985-Amphidinium_carterae.1